MLDLVKELEELFIELRKYARDNDNGSVSMGVSLRKRLKVVRDYAEAMIFLSLKKDNERRVSNTISNDMPASKHVLRLIEELQLDHSVAHTEESLKAEKNKEVASTMEIEAEEVHDKTVDATEEQEDDQETKDEEKPTSVEKKSKQTSAKQGKKK